MDETTANPVIILLMFVLRCLVPLAIMIGISYILRRFGLIKIAPLPPNGNGNDAERESNSEGGLGNEKT